MPKAVDTYDRSDAGKIAFERLFMQDMILDLTTEHEDMEYYLTASMLAVCEGYVRPDGFEPCNLIYDYGAFCVVISFVEYGENVVMANGCICVPEITEELTELPDGL